MAGGALSCPHTSNGDFVMKYHVMIPANFNLLERHGSMRKSEKKNEIGDLIPRPRKAVCITPVFGEDWMW